jgi:hypothetical protein
MKGCLTVKLIDVSIHEVLFMRKVIMKPFCARLAPEVYVLANFQNVQLLCGQEAPLMFVNCFRFSKMLPEIFCIC